MMSKTERRRITMERVFQAPIEDVWELWTTKDGIESWWGPDGFRVEVRKLDLRPGGELLYDMIAVAPEMVAFMKQSNAPVSTAARIRYTEIVPSSKLAYVHVADFIPGVNPYDVQTQVELFQQGGSVRMVLSFDAMHDELWTERATMGWTQELGKLAAVLEKPCAIEDVLGAVDAVFERARREA